ncbi:sensor histidine kinase [Micromonospora sp. NBC_00362]|uniref:sensor histidine kinase n=1 Tax=Micromonospora sp. NBC_00362 TaxID=2975975 RepID=UPI00224D630A|nr:sensor histidine kinase [Micromonospora sp. NBC_00362]MCX5118270.1 sensor histidine kinase [Micromonospora sp. NBC_00362]
MRQGGQWRWPEVAADAALALVLLGFGLLATGLAGDNQPGSRPVDAASRALIAVAALALLVRRRSPVAALAVVTVATSTYLLTGYPYGPILVTFLVAVYTVAVRLPVRPAALATGGAFVLLLAHVFFGQGPAPGWTGVLPASAWVVVPLAVGVVVRVSREATARTRAEEARRRVEQARRQADEERLRIAQEVHDVVGHGLAAISMQAEIALHLLPKRPEQAEVALTAISRTSREALDELRVTLGAVRRGAERGPVPGLARLPALRDRLAGAGLAVEVRVVGDPREVPAAVDLAAYRVVQEALTNVLRHAGVASAEVTVGYRADEVTVEVTDRGVGAGRPGTAPADDEGGHGLAGMRERVAALGGRLSTGPRAGGGFRVYAGLPVEPTT